MAYRGMGGKYSVFLAWTFFVLGIIGAIGLRFVLIFQRYDARFALTSWYIAMTAFLFFYLYRYIIENKRRKIILENKLKEKIEKRELDENDYKQIERVLDSLLVSKSKVNFLILFLLTILALILQIILGIK